MTTKYTHTLSTTAQDKLNRALSHLGTQRNNPNIETPIREDRYDIKINENVSLYVELDEDEDIELLLFIDDEELTSPASPPEILNENSETFNKFIKSLNEVLKANDSVSAESISLSKYQKLSDQTTYIGFL